MADDDKPDGTLDARVGKIETEQERQGGLLDQILDRLPGKTGGDPPVTSADPPAQGDPAEMAEQMRQAVRDVNAEAAAAEAAKKQPPPPEVVPREVMVKGKARLQRAIFGADR